MGYRIIIVNIFKIFFNNNLINIKDNKINKKEGIIFSSVVVINSAPTLNSTELFTVHSGTKLEITDRIGDWIHIKISDGRNGWTLQNLVKEL